MTLMSLVRWMGVVVIGWTLVAIGVGATGARFSGREAAVLVHAGSRLVEAMPTSWPIARRYDLLDRTDGRRTPIRLPAEDRWSFVSVSPWHGPQGELEAVGRWVNPGRDDFGGWGVFRLSDGVVLSRVATETLPTGRPCWVPGQPGKILFAAGDGRLYLCRLNPDQDRPVIGQRSNYSSGRAEPSDPLIWEVATPGEGEPILSDPVWPTNSRLNRWIFATLMPLENRGRKVSFGVPQLWWLEVSDDARSIVAAGRLTRPIPGGEAVAVEERFPSVAVGPEGEIRLAYLERRISDNTYRLRSALLEFDSRTGRPKAVTGVHSPVPDAQSELQPTPLLISADGATVYGYSLSGELAALPVARPGGEAQPLPSAARTRFQP